MSKSDYLHGLIDLLYEQESAGGPLHIITDDFNIADEILIYCYREVYQNETCKEIRTLCLAILHELMLLTEEEREYFFKGRGE